MTLGDSRANGRKRSFNDLRPVGNEADVGSLASGIYDIEGEEVSINFHDSVHSNSAGGDVISPSDAPAEFQTTQGKAAWWNQTFGTTVDLQAVIKEQVARQKQKARRDIGRRDWHQKCIEDGESDSRWVVLQAGKWEKGAEKASGCMAGRVHYTQGTGVETCQSFSINLSAALTKSIASVTGALDFNWQTCYTQSSIRGCDWKEGEFASKCAESDSSRSVSCDVDQAENVLAARLRHRNQSHR